MKYFVALLFAVCTLPAMAQSNIRRKDMINFDSVIHGHVRIQFDSLIHSHFRGRVQSQEKPVPVSRWILSYNPLGLFEWPSAFGAGIGYRINSRLELWTEGAFLFNNGKLTQGPVTGFKQVLQTKFFLQENSNFFVAAEIRYKSYQYRDSGRFYNAATGDTLKSFSSFSHHYFWGGAIQLGWRTSVSRRLQMEIVAGVGMRKYVHTWYDVPPGYTFDPDYGIDVKIYDIKGATPDWYIPGSVRLLWLFGKKLRP